MERSHGALMSRQALQRFAACTQVSVTDVGREPVNKAPQTYSAKQSVEAMKLNIRRESLSEWTIGFARQMHLVAKGDLPIGEIYAVTF
jgi:hypothetical protein